MKPISPNRSIPFFLALFLLLAGGCASTPSSRFYTLGVLSAPVRDSAAQPLDRGLVLGIGPIRFPDYLERPGIVTRTNANRIDIAEFDLWAGSLKEDFTRVVAENLSVLLETEKIVLYPYTGSIATSFRVIINVDRFEGTQGKAAYLEATWIILEGPENKGGISKKTRLTEPVPGEDYHSLVAAQSRAVERLTREIAEAIRSLPGAAEK